MPKISIIVPVFNAQTTISDCLASLAGQSLDDIEIIIVDDHGSDKSIQKAREFVTVYNGAKTFVFTQTDCNSGPGEARNAGLKVANGEFVAFVDSDDYIDCRFCEKLYGLAERTCADLACCDIEIDGRILRNAETADKKHFLRHFVSYFTTFIYRRQLLEENGIRFPVNRSAEDTCFLTCSILAARNIAQIHEPLYHYITHNDSVSRKKDRTRALSRMKSICRILDFAKASGYYGEYRKELCFLTLKKGFAMALKDLIKG